MSGQYEAEVIQGDALHELIKFPSEFVHCCVTSPPYWGLRDYGVAGQIGLEKTPEEWCARLVEVFREVRRVLHPSGTLWINVGDSYAAAGYSNHDNSVVGGLRRGDGGSQKHRSNTRLKPKDLIGLPWMLAFALRADGWWLRSDIIWHKPNPMPESVTDRPTKSHEYIFLLSKSEKYFFNAEAIQEPAEFGRGTGGFRGEGAYTKGQAFDNSNRNAVKANTQGHTYNGIRNKRTVWTIPTEANPEQHLASFPTDLVKPCILAGTSAKGVCPCCGEPWERTIETLGWLPGCDHNAGTQKPGIVLDPFAGTFTTCAVALELGRHTIGIELNPDYIEIGKRRIQHTTPGFPQLA